MNTLQVSFRILMLLSVLSVSAPAQWSGDPSINTPVCTAAGDQYYPEMIPLDSGGVIVAWHDVRSGITADMYVQKFDSTGTTQWILNGVELSAAAGHQWFKAITSDGAGGAIVAWMDTRYDPIVHDLYVRRVDASGTPLWTDGGVPISVAGSHDEYPSLAPDGLGGAFIAWGGTNLSAQRVNAAGAVQWSANGITLALGSGMYDNRWPKTIADDSGGVIIVWQHESFSTGWDIYAQRLSASGATLWTASGVPVCAASGFQEKPTIVSDDSGGVIITWEDHRSGSWDIYAQRLDRYGTRRWTPGGVPVCVANSDQRAPLGNTGTTPVITRDGAGGAIITWQDSRSGDWAVYAQRLNGSASALWNSGGVLLSAVGGQQNPAITGDDSGGAIITWESSSGGTGIDIFAQGIDSSGTTLWNATGVPVSNAPLDQIRPQIATDHAGGAIVSWIDFRTGGDADIYIQNIAGTLEYVIPPMEPAIVSIQDVRFDQGGTVTVAWSRAAADTTPAALITGYSIWRGIELAHPPEGARFIIPGEMDGEMTGKYYRVIAGSPAGTYWELVGTVPAHYLEGYSFTAGTLYDSTAEDPGWFKFFVSAHTADPFQFYDSGIDSGYSVDNLSPAAVSMLNAVVNTGPSVALHWRANANDPDVRHYEIHRSVVPGFTPGPSTILDRSPDTLFVDGSPALATVNYYRVVTVDLHGNMSPASIEIAADPSIVPVDGDRAFRIPESFGLAQNYPNPFNPVTSISYALPSGEYVRLSVFTTLGQEVATLVDEYQEAGSKTVSFDAGSLPSGIYAYRISAGAYSGMRKMLLIK